jgi:hypothetical protein
MELPDVKEVHGDAAIVKSVCDVLGHAAGVALAGRKEDDDSHVRLPDVSLTRLPIIRRNRMHQP